MRQGNQQQDNRKHSGWKRVLRWSCPRTAGEGRIIERYICEHKATGSDCLTDFKDGVNVHLLHRLRDSGAFNFLSVEMDVQKSRSNVEPHFLY